MGKSNEVLRGITSNEVQSAEAVAAAAVRGLLAGSAVIVTGNLNKLTV